MKDLLKGNYNMDSYDDLSQKADSLREKAALTEVEIFKEKAKSSIGGSMVFVERERLVWDGE
ncbi:MAG: hypothetical protein RH862_14825 [Leptospiraceae bacterium]